VSELAGKKRRKLTANVAPVYQREGIERIELQNDEDDTGGILLFLFRNLEPECAADEWYPSLEQAKATAFRRWGIAESNWTVLE
jgi:hypothetical protein